MDKGAYKKPDRPIPAAQRRKNTLKVNLANDNKNQLHSSDDNLSRRPTKSGLPRKTSTPTDTTSKSVSPDISLIPGDEPSINASRKLFTKQKPPEGNPNKKTAPTSKVDLDEMLDFEYTRYLQAMYKMKLEQAKCTETVDEIANVQKKIEENEAILNKTKKRLENITFNKEIDMLHSLHNPDFGKALETLNESNCEDYLLSLNKKLEQNHNRLELKNMEAPEGGGAQLMKVISETLEAYEKLKSDCNVETPKLLADIKESHKGTVDSLSWVKENLPKAEELLLEKTTYEIIAQTENE